MRYRPVDSSRLTTYSLRERTSKVSVEYLARPHDKGASFGSFVERLPGFLAARDIRAVAQAVVAAFRNGRPVILGMGAHALKVGLSPIIIDLMQRGVINAVATNGACIIHDFELACIGQTSEDVARELCTGTFGMAEETGRLLNEAISRGVAEGQGIGRAVGSFIDAADFPFKDRSIFREGFRKDIPMTVHVGIGADIIHMHHAADGARIGEGSLRDFRLFAGVVAELEGGVYLNLGSAVMLPEVFLKALTMARNLGHTVESFTTVNMDFIQHYRPRENVLRRPTMGKGRCFALTGHHEIMVPLLAALIIEEL
ncbi:MAG: hypothetical protein AB1805_03060 [Nitrospirota bacterium]